MAAIRFAWAATDISTCAPTLIRRMASFKSGLAKKITDALMRFESQSIEPFAPPPPAWVHEPPRRQPWAPTQEDVPIWRDPDIYFNHDKAEMIVGSFPVEAWCGTTNFGPMFYSYLDQLAAWTLSKIAPEWENEENKSRQGDHVNLNLWPTKFADLISRAAPFMSADTVISRYLGPFSNVPNDAGLAIIAHFTDLTTCRHVYDAETISDDTIRLLRSFKTPFIGRMESFAPTFRVRRVLSRTP